MPPAISSPPQSRPWWSRSKSSKDSLRPNRSISTLADDDDKYPSTPPTSSSKNRDAPIIPLNFNTLASAIGLKSKKLPALTIQDPPSSLPSPHPRPYSKSRPGSGNSSVHSPAPAERNPYYTNRPPAQSVSTVRSLDYDYDAASELHSEPRTPSDHPRDRFSYQHSIMTFSEIDPFASGGIVVQHLPQDPNRLSVYSDSSMVDPQQKCADAPPTNRGSYGSSSSNSHRNSSDAQAQSPLSPNSVGRSPPASRSAYDLSQTHDAYYAERSSGTSSQAHRTRMKTPSGSNSSNSTITQHDLRSRLSEPPAGHPAHLMRKRSTPALVRPRGMTVGAIDHRPSKANVTSIAAPVPPLQPRQQGTTSASSSPNTPSPSPVVFSRSRTPSTTSTRIDSPITPSSPRPTVVVRKASASRLPVAPAPPTSNLPPPPPLPSLSPYHRSPIEFRASSSSSSLDFAPSIDYHDIDTGDAISHLMNDSYDYGPFESPRGSSKGKHRSNRSTYVVDGDLSPSALDNDSALPSPLSKFPPVPSLIHGEIHSKAGKLLKKMSSQQNLLQRHSATSTTSSVSWMPEEPNGSGSSQASSTAGKTPRKQRSFHASRVPLPPMPNLRGSSGNGYSSEVFPQPSSPVVEPRRSSVTSPRKRLFSGSSARRSTSSHGPTSAGAEDDKRSILSFDSDIRPVTSSGIESITMSFNSAGGSLSLLTRNACISPSSLWEDTNTGGGDNKRTSQSEYTPQYIMAPADQLKLAEELAVEETTTSERDATAGSESDRVPKLDLQPGDFGLTYSVAPNALRSRSNSVLSNQSTGTVAFGNDKPAFTRGTSLLSTKSSVSSSNGRPTAATAAPTTSTDAIRSPARSSSMLARAPHKPPVLSARPSTAQASLTPPTSPGFMQTTHIDTPSGGLPPPPRRRPSRHDLQEHQAGKRASFVPMNPLSPPPSTRSAWNPRPESSDTTSSMVSRPPSSFDRQKVAKRRSLMKKPSFLDIEDELDATAENGSDDEYGDETSTPEDPTMESSFLDMDRGKNSFDTVRSTDSAFFV